MTMSKIEALPDELIDELMAPIKPVVARGVITDEDDGIEVFICEHCGSCEDPQHCVWGVQCPKCFAPPHEHCLDDRGALTGLHQERWDHAGSDWRY